MHGVAGKLGQVPVRDERVAIISCYREAQSDVAISRTTGNIKKIAASLSFLAITLCRSSQPDQALGGEGQVERHTETDMNLVECFCPGANGCRIESGCLLRSALRSALRAFLGVLDQYALSDLLGSKPLLEELLGVPALKQPFQSHSL